MGRKREHRERVLGPYERQRKGRRVWIVRLVAPDGETRDRQFATERAAHRFRDAVATELESTSVNVGQTIDEYLRALERKGNKEGSRYRTRWSLTKFFPNPDEELGLLTKRDLAKRYEALAEALKSAASHRGALAEAKTFLRWCVAQHYLEASPLEDVKGVGRRRKGKTQLRFEEARKWYKVALELAGRGDDGAIAALLAPILGPRASEIVALRVRDVDRRSDPADTLWIADSKTPAGRRALEVPAELRPLLAALSRGRPGEAWLFPTGKGETGRHWRDWVRKQVHRICAAAGVPRVSAHGMRGLHATIALELGATGALVAGALGHEDERTTRSSYADAERVAAGVRRRTLRVLQGGREEP